MAVYSCAFSANAEYALSGALDGSIKVLFTFRFSHALVAATLTIPPAVRYGMCDPER